MWPWRRSPRDAPSTAARTAAPPRDEWRALPPLQRTVGEPALINPPERMHAALASWRDPRYLEPLGHAVAAEEPSGLIGDPPPPAPQTHADAGDLPVVAAPPGVRLARFVQRFLASPERPRPATVTATPHTEPDAGRYFTATALPQPVAEPPGSPEYEAPASEPAILPEESAVEPEAVETRATTGGNDLPTVQADASGEPEPADAPRAGRGDDPHAVPASGFGEPEATGTAPTVGGTAAPSVVHLPQRPVVEGPAAVQRSTTAGPAAGLRRPDPAPEEGPRVPGATRVDHSRTPDAAPPPSPPVQRNGEPGIAALSDATPGGGLPTDAGPGGPALDVRAGTGVPRRLGLGEPVVPDRPGGPPGPGTSGLPPPVVQRMQPVPTDQPRVGEPAGAGAETQLAAEEPPTVGPAGEQAPTLGVSVDARYDSTPGPRPPTSSDARGHSFDAPNADAATAEVHPATGHGFTDEPVLVQRAVETSGGEAAPVAATPPLPVVGQLRQVRPPTQPDRMSPAERSPVIARLIGDRPLPLTSHVESSIGPSRTEPEPAPAGPESTGAAPASANGRPAFAQRMIATGTAPGGLGTGGPEAAVALPRRNGPTPAFTPPVASPLAVVQRAAGPPVPDHPVVVPAAVPVQVAGTVAYAPIEPPTVTIQRQAEPPSLPPSVSGPSPGSPPPAPAHAAGGEPEELVNKLYDPLLRRLKADLWIDRDRRGSLTDLPR